jgi:hypothetical protein
MSEKTDKALAVISRPKTTQSGSQAGLLERMQAVEHLILEFAVLFKTLKGSDSKGGKKK